MTQGQNIEAAQQYLIDLVFNRWYRFDEIPDGIFDEVFELIDENFRGWIYYFDDFDESFKKELTGYINTTTRSSERKKKREEFRKGQEDGWKKEILNLKS